MWNEWDIVDAWEFIAHDEKLELLFKFFLKESTTVILACKPIQEENVR